MRTSSILMFPARSRQADPPLACNDPANQTHQLGHLPGVLTTIDIRHMTRGIAWCILSPMRPPAFIARLSHSGYAPGIDSLGRAVVQVPHRRSAAKARWQSEYVGSHASDGQRQARLFRSLDHGGTQWAPHGRIVEPQRGAGSQAPQLPTTSRLLATPRLALAPNGEYRRRYSGRPALSTLACAIVKERTDNLAIDDPHIRCLPDNFIRAYGMPHLLKFVHTPDLLVMLNEMNAGYRQVFTDARPLPEDPSPSWQGYSSGKWSGDTLVIDTIGLRDDTWIDWNGSVVTQSAKVREQIRRPDFGHIESRSLSMIPRPTPSPGPSR